MSDRTVTERHRLIRVLEYTGTKSWIETSLMSREVKEEWRCPNGTIREGIIGRSMSLVEPEVRYEEAYEAIHTVIYEEDGGVHPSTIDGWLEALSGAGFRLTRQ